VHGVRAVRLGDLVVRVGLQAGVDPVADASEHDLIAGLDRARAERALEVELGEDTLAAGAHEAVDARLLVEELIREVVRERGRLRGIGGRDGAAAVLVLRVVARHQVDAIRVPIPIRESVAGVDGTNRHEALRPRAVLGEKAGRRRDGDRAGSKHEERRQRDQLRAATCVEQA
jgi:hypothetical protein